jgi:hypothetical protein
MNVSADWIVGFSDGEAAFQILIHYQEKSTSFSVESRFTIGLGPREMEVLKAIKEYFGVGEIVNRDLSHTRRVGINSKDQVHYIVRGLDCRVINNFFKKNQLKTVKRANFEIWSKILTLLQNGRQRHIMGLLEIAKLRDQMQVKTRDYRYRSYEWFKSHYGLNGSLVVDETLKGREAQYSREEVE